MQLSEAGERRRALLESQEGSEKDPYASIDNWTLREVGHRQPLDESRFYTEVTKTTTINPSALRASVNRLLSQGLVIA